MEDKSQNKEDSTENDMTEDSCPHQEAQNQTAASAKKRSFPSPHDLIGEHAASMESTRKQRQNEGSRDPDASSNGGEIPSAKRSKAAAAAASVSHGFAAEGTEDAFGTGGGGETPPMKSHALKGDYTYEMSYVTQEEQEVKTPMPTTDQKSHVRRSHSSGSVSSELSSSSASTTQRHEALSPIPPSYISEVPPAPPSTPASTTSNNVWDFGASMTPAGLMTPLSMQPAVANASQLEQQQLLMEGAATPAPTRGDKSATAKAPHTVLSDDFSDWAVGERYEMVRVLGRGSYGEVAQAIDLRVGRRDAFVAIKRIQSPFDQEVDAIRLYREIHILRQMRGHECIIQLIDVVQPPSDDLDDFHDLYLVFECKWLLLRD